MSNDITIRAAGPQDGPLAAGLILSTGPDLFDYVFYSSKQKNLTLLKQLFAAEVNAFSYTCAQIAEYDGQPAGLIHFVDSEEKKAGNQAMAGTLMKLIGGAAFLIRIPRFFQVNRLIPGFGEDTCYIQHLATLAAFRRRGVGRSLLEFCEKQAFKRRLGCLMLDVETVNTPAIGLYESFGFTTVRQMDSRFLRRKYDFRGLFRMVKPITGLERQKTDRYLPQPANGTQANRNYRFLYW